LVVVDRPSFVAVFVRVTVAPLTSALLGSLTIPEIDPVAVCADPSETVTRVPASRVNRRVRRKRVNGSRVFLDPVGRMSAGEFDIVPSQWLMVGSVSGSLYKAEYPSWLI
jgi:hypothetical protein